MGELKRELKIEIVGGSLTVTKTLLLLQVIAIPAFILSGLGKEGLVGLTPSRTLTTP